MCDENTVADNAALLAGGAPGLHIYTLNRANASFLLWQRLNQADRTAA